MVEKADFRARELLFNYKQTVLNAVREVDTAVAGFAAQRRPAAPPQRRADRGAASRKPRPAAVRARSDRFRPNVIDAQRQEYVLEQEYVSAQATAAEQFVALYRSLGGGWEGYQSLPPIPEPLPAIAAAFKRLWTPQAVR